MALVSGVYGITKEGDGMAKVTVYVTDEQLDRLKSARGVGKGGMSKAFQAFLEHALAGNEAPAGRYDYARKLMPVSAAIDRHRRLLAQKVADGGPPADGGPVSAALTLLLYRELLKRDPGLEAALEKEFIRFGLDELVGSETADVDLLSEPDPDDPSVEIDDDDAPSTGFGFAFGDELKSVSDALRTGEIIRESLRMARAPRPPRPPRPPRAPRAPRHPGESRERRIEIRLSPDDDPRQVLTGAEFDRFARVHDDWTVGAKLSPSQLETVRDFLRDRVERDLDDEDDDE